MGIERPGGPYGAEMTAPPAWPEADETTLLDAADAFDADQKAVDEQLWVFQQARTRLFDDEAWSGQAANAAHAKHRQQIATLQAHVDGSAAAAKLYRNCAGVVVSTKQQIIANVEDAQKLINQVANDSQATAEQKDFFIKELVKATHAENVQLVQVGATKLGKPPTSPLTVRPASNGREVPLTPPTDRPSTEVPEDPKQFADWWQGLTREQKDQIYSYDHAIGNHPGMPWDPPDHLGKDHYNRLHLPELEQKTQADIDRMQHSLEEMMRGHNVDDGALYALQTQLAASRNHLQGYKAMEAELNSKDGPKRYLGQVDEFGHGAIAINNPDTATRNAILVPGTGQDLTTIGGADNKSLAMYNAALRADPNLKPGDVAVTTWMGYDRPMGVDHADFPNLARAGAGSLDAFQAGERASHVGAPSIDTVVGHSYGTTVVGAAASGGHQLDANNVIAVGSPGMLVDHAGDLRLDAGSHVYAMRAQNDIIGAAGAATQWTLGSEPDKPDFGAIRLQADPGPAGPFGSPSVDAHSSYWNDPRNKALLNMGSIIAGKQPPFVIGPR